MDEPCGELKRNGMEPLSRETSGKRFDVNQNAPEKHGGEKNGEGVDSIRREDSRKGDGVEVIGCDARGKRIAAHGFGTRGKGYEWK